MTLSFNAQKRVTAVRDCDGRFSLISQGTKDEQIKIKAVRHEDRVMRSDALRELCKDGQ